MKHIPLILAWALFVALSLLTAEVYRQEARVRQFDADRVVLEHISYGLFNIDEWKVIVAEVIARKIDDFEVTDANRDDVRKKTEDVLHAIINEIEHLMRERNKQSWSGVFKQFFAEMLFSFDELRADVPRYAEIVVERIDDEDTKKAVKEWLVEKINSFADATVGEMDYSAMNEVLARHGCADRDSCTLMIAALRQDVRSEGRLAVWALSAFIAALFALIMISRERMVILACTLSSAVLLAGGVALPMIDIEATITHFSFALMGEPVTFDNQVIFYQSKSIIEVVTLLLVNGDVPLIAVSFLILAFSVLLPLGKLALSCYSLIIGRAPGGRMARFVLVRSAKWSMADVMVVALFMAFIGFSGVINNQLTQIERGDASLEVFTTNNSTLRLGFYLFTAYALTGLQLSERLLNMNMPLPKGSGMHQ